MTRRPEAELLCSLTPRHPAKAGDPRRAVSIDRVASTNTRTIKNRAHFFDLLTGKVRHHHRLQPRHRQKHIAVEYAKAGSQGGISPKPQGGRCRAGRQRLKAQGFGGPALPVACPCRRQGPVAKNWSSKTARSLRKIETSCIYCERRHQSGY